MNKILSSLKKKKKKKSSSFHAQPSDQQIQKSADTNSLTHSLDGDSAIYIDLLDLVFRSKAVVIFVEQESSSSRTVGEEDGHENGGRTSK